MNGKSPSSYRKLNSKNIFNQDPYGMSQLNKFTDMSSIDMNNNADLSFNDNENDNDNFNQNENENENEITSTDANNITCYNNTSCINVDLLNKVGSSKINF